jgi:hypothetical protein
MRENKWSYKVSEQAGAGLEFWVWVFEIFKGRIFFGSLKYRFVAYN